MSSLILQVYSNLQPPQSGGVLNRIGLRLIKGFKSVTIIEREKNWGLAASIIDGVTNIVNQYGKIIVLEDDIVTSHYFLKFMNDALNYYADNPKVWSISGYNYPIKNNGLGEAFFYRNGSSWGWGTWKYRWIFFKKIRIS
jgi:hypothetical protein